MKRLFALVLPGVFLVGCVTTQPAPILPTNQPQQEGLVDMRISDAAKKIEGLLLDLSAAKDQQSESVDKQVQENLGFLVSVSWIGDIETVVTKLADSVGMRHRVIGRPLAPVFVSIDLKDAPLADAYRIIGMQAGSRADIVYRPGENVIELIYVQ